MDTSPQTNNQMTRSTAITFLLVIIVIILGAGAYFLFFQEEGINDNKANATNTNQVADTNQAANANTATNTNIDTSGWKTYTNSEYGYTMKYPADWTVEERKLLEDPYDESRQSPFRSVDFYSPGKKYMLNVYVKKITDSGTSILGGGIAGTFSDMGKVQVGQYYLPAIQTVENNKVKGFFIPSAGQETTIDGYQFGAQFADMTDDYYKVDLLDSVEYYQALSILKLLELEK